MNAPSCFRRSFAWVVGIPLASLILGVPVLWLADKSSEYALDALAIGWVLGTGALVSSLAWRQGEGVWSVPWGVAAVVSTALLGWLGLFALLVLSGGGE